MSEHRGHHSSFLDYKLKRKKWVNLENPEAMHRLNEQRDAHDMGVEAFSEPQLTDKQKMRTPYCDGRGTRNATPENSKSDEDSGIQSDAGSCMSASKRSQQACNSECVSPNGSSFLEDGNSSNSKDSELLMQEEEEGHTNMKKEAMHSWKNIADSILDIEHERKQKHAAPITGFGNQAFNLPHAVIHSPKEMENKEDLPLMTVPVESSMGRMFVNFPVLMNQGGNVMTERPKPAKKCDRAGSPSTGKTKPMTSASTVPAQNRVGNHNCAKAGAVPMDVFYPELKRQACNDSIPTYAHFPNMETSWKDNPLVNGFGFNGMNMMYGRHPCSRTMMNPFVAEKETGGGRKSVHGGFNQGCRDNTGQQSCVTNWEYLDKVHQSQKEQMNLRKQEQQHEKQTDEEAMNCDICGDNATGLHYGIISCEGCKGFFKRTVQNRRVYTCVNKGNCEVTKNQRNRCQFCRFKKCLEKGMVMAAVREDRMPGGRNSGAVYKLYKVRYRKHRQKMLKFHGGSSTSNSSASSQDDNLSLFSSDSGSITGSVTGSDGFNDWSGSPIKMQVQRMADDTSDEIQEKRMTMPLDHQKKSANPAATDYHHKDKGLSPQFSESNLLHPMSYISHTGADHNKEVPIVFGDLNPRCFIEVAGRKLRFGCNKTLEASSKVSFNEIFNICSNPDEGLSQSKEAGIVSQSEMNTFVRTSGYESPINSNPSSGVMSSAFLPIQSSAGSSVSHSKDNVALVTMASAAPNSSQECPISTASPLKYSRAQQNGGYPINVSEMNDDQHHYAHFGMDVTSRKVLPIPTTGPPKNQALLHNAAKSYPSTTVPLKESVFTRHHVNEETRSTQSSYQLPDRIQSVNVTPSFPGPSVNVDDNGRIDTVKRLYIKENCTKRGEGTSHRKVPHSVNSGNHHGQYLRQKFPPFVENSLSHYFEVRNNCKTDMGNVTREDIAESVSVRDDGASHYTRPGQGVTELHRMNGGSTSHSTAIMANQKSVSPEADDDRRKKPSVDPTENEDPLESCSEVFKQGSGSSFPVLLKTINLFQQQETLGSEGELLIQQLISREDFQGGVLRQQLPMSQCKDLSEILSQIGDEVVCQLVPWMKKLPFYGHMSLATSTQILLNHWHEILLLASCTNQAWQLDEQKPILDTQQQFVFNLQKVHSYMTRCLGHTIKFYELFSEIGETVEKVTKLIYSFIDMKISREEFVCMKVILLLSEGDSVSEKIRGCYRSSLEGFISQKWLEEKSRVAQLDEIITNIRSTAEDLLLQKLFYVPLVLNTGTREDQSAGV